MLGLFLLILGFSSVCSTGYSVNKIRLCQGDITDLHCPRGQHLHVDNAKYGRFVSPSVACDHDSFRSHHEFYNCSSDVTDIIRRECEYQSACSIKATNRMLGDPCKRTYKHLDITFACTQNTEPTPAQTPSVTSDNHFKQFMIQIENCTRLYNKVKTVNHCDALLLYISCVKALESSFKNYVSTIDNALATLQNSYNKCTFKPTEPLIRICKKRSMLGECRNITQSTARLDHFDNAVKSIHVFGGSWILYTGKNFRGEDYFVASGFRSNWLGIYTPVQGENIKLASNQLSSVRRVDDEQVEEPTTSLTEEYTRAVELMSTNGFTGDSFRSTPMFFGASSTEGSAPSTDHGDSSTTGHSTWIYLDALINSNQYSKLCRANYCLLGVRIACSNLDYKPIIDPKHAEKVIVKTLVEEYHVRPEQIVAAELEQYEVIIEIIDLKEDAVRVIDVAMAINHKLKAGQFKFRFFTDEETYPVKDRYNLMLKSMNEEDLPVIRKETTPTQTVSTQEEEKDNSTPYKLYTISSTDEDSTSTEPTMIYDDLDEVKNRIDDDLDELESDFMKAPYTYLYIIVASVLTVLLLVAGILQYKRYSARASTDYTLIKKVPSNVYVPIGNGAKKNLEGFENPSYLLDEVDQ